MALFGRSARTFREGLKRLSNSYGKNVLRRSDFKNSLALQTYSTVAIDDELFGLTEDQKQVQRESE